MSPQLPTPDIRCLLQYCPLNGEYASKDGIAKTHYTGPIIIRPLLEYGELFHFHYILM